MRKVLIGIGLAAVVVWLAVANRHGNPAMVAISGGPDYPAVTFGTPVLKSPPYGTELVVDVTNPGGLPVTCSIQAEFRRDGQICGMALGSVAQLPAGASRAVTLVSTEKLDCPDITLTTSACF